MVRSKSSPSLPAATNSLSQGMGSPKRNYTRAPESLIEALACFSYLEPMHADCMLQTEVYWLRRYPRCLEAKSQKLSWAGSRQRSSHRLSEHDFMVGILGAFSGDPSLQEAGTLGIAGIVDRVKKRVHLRPIMPVLALSLVAVADTHDLQVCLHHVHAMAIRLLEGLHGGRSGAAPRGDVLGVRLGARLLSALPRAPAVSRGVAEVILHPHVLRMQPRSPPQPAVELQLHGVWRESDTLGARETLSPQLVDQLKVLPLPRGNSVVL